MTLSDGLWEQVYALAYTLAWPIGKEKTVSAATYFTFAVVIMLMTLSLVRPPDRRK